MAVPQTILEINTRVWVRQFGQTLAEVPDSVLDDWSRLGFQAVWLMGVWLPSEESRRIALEHAGLHEEYSKALPDWGERDVIGSPFAVCGYVVNPALGGNVGLSGFRQRLLARGMRLILDFIPNHTARDHPWVTEHTDWYVLGTEADVIERPDGYFWVQTDDGLRAVAHGRDPYFPSWTDTAQLDYFNPETQAAMRAELARIATMCDGVRCDMAMLVLSSVFEQVWGHWPEEFWPATISETRRINPGFTFMAEVYWGLDGALREMGFDLTYDKDLLDVIANGLPMRRELFDAPLNDQRGRVRFLENHDEPRIASRLPSVQQKAAATWVFMLPSTRLIYDGQLEGRQLRLPVQLAREPHEPANAETLDLYEKLLPVLKRDVVRKGAWLLLLPRLAWSGNESHENILGQSYHFGHESLCVFVNWSDSRSQCWVNLGLGQLTGLEVEMRDLLGTKVFVREGVPLMLRGLYLDMEPWEAQVFECVIRSETEVAQ